MLTALRNELFPKMTSWATSYPRNVGANHIINDIDPFVGTVTSVATGTGLSGGPITTTGTISLANTAVTPGNYTNSNITVDSQGRLTAASNGSGVAANIAQAAKTNTFSTTSTSLVAITGLSVTITPTSATSKVLIQSHISVSHFEFGEGVIQLYRDATPILTGDTAGSRSVGTITIRNGTAASSYDAPTYAITYLDSPATTSAVTYSLYAKTSDVLYATVINGAASDVDSNGVGRSTSTIIVQEMKQ